MADVTTCRKATRLIIDGLEAEQLWNKRAVSDAETRMAEYETALRWYADQFCELGKYHECCGKMSDDDCGGCKARAALTTLAAELAARREALWDCIAVIRKDLEGPAQVEAVLRRALALVPDYGDANDPDLAALASPPQETGGFHIGQEVEKYTGDYVAPGEIRSVFRTKAGKLRFVVEHTWPGGTGGFLHIYSENNLRPKPGDET